MNKLIPTLCIAAAALTLVSCASHRNPASLPPGEYSKTQKSTNAEGTETTRETQTDVYYDQYGNKRAIEKTETSSDPKGLMNKSTSTSTKSY